MCMSTVVMQGTLGKLETEEVLKCIEECRHRSTAHDDVFGEGLGSSQGERGGVWCDRGRVARRQGAIWWLRERCRRWKGRFWS